MLDRMLNKLKYALLGVLSVATLAMLIYFVINPGHFDYAGSW